MKKIVFTAVILTALAFSAGAAVITEKQVVDSALKNNPDIAAAEKRAGSYEAKSHRRFFLKNPMVGFDVMAVNDNTVNLGAGAQKFLVITQEIPEPFAFFWEAAAASDGAEGYKYAYEMKKFEIRAAARAEYYELYKTLKFIDITKETAGIVKQAADIAFVKYNQGAVSQQDVLKADLEKDILENDITTLNRQKETGIQALRKYSGDENITGEGDFSLEEPRLAGLKYGFDDIKKMVLSGAPYVKKAEAEKREWENSRNATIAGYIPGLSVEFKKSVDPGSDNYELMVEAELPIFFLNNQQADIGEKLDMAQAKGDELAETRDKAVLEAKDDYDTVKSDFSSLELYKSRLIPEAEAGLSSALASYQSKKTGFLDLLDSERMLLDLKKDYYMRLAEYLTHFRMLEELAGNSLE
jgi:outer membrane protein TolC